MREASRQWNEVAPGREPIWIFGYGSLMWDPGFDYAERHWGRLDGWHRQFSICSTRAWGNVKQPGLCLALHAGGAAAGMVYRLNGVGSRAVMAALDQRERAYRRISVNVSLPDAETVSAVTYVYDPAHPRSRHGLSLAEQAALIAGGAGEKGASRDYLEKTVALLAQNGCAEPYLTALYRAVAQHDTICSVPIVSSSNNVIFRSVEREADDVIRS